MGDWRTLDAATWDRTLQVNLTAGPEFISATIDKTPLRRLGKPEEIAALAAVLVSAEAGVITGQTLVIDGQRALGN